MEPHLQTDVRRSLVAESRQFIEEEFPILAARWRPDSRPVSFGFGLFDGHATHAGAIDPRWFRHAGRRPFLAASMPDRLWAVGIQNRGTSEVLVALWREGPRRFWFVDPYVIFVAEGGPSVEATNAKLADALVRWDQRAP